MYVVQVEVIQLKLVNGLWSTVQIAPFLCGASQSSAAQTNWRCVLYFKKYTFIHATSSRVQDKVALSAQINFSKQQYRAYHCWWQDWSKTILISKDNLDQLVLARSIALDCYWAVISKDNPDQQRPSWTAKTILISKDHLNELLLARSIALECSCTDGCGLMLIKLIRLTPKIILCSDQQRSSWSAKIILIRKDHLDQQRSSWSANIILISKDHLDEQR